jgi:hemolysin activation/secretion protein
MFSTFPHRRIAALAGLACLPAFAQVPADISDHQLQRQQERERVQAAQAEQHPDVRLPRGGKKSAAAYPPKEVPCFPIRQVELAGENAKRYAWAVSAADDALGRCLGSVGVNVLIGQVQNALVAAGYVTTRVLAAPQDLGSGKLTLTLVPGRVRAIRFVQKDPHALAWTALPVSAGDILNVRDIEQGLENFKRVPTVEADLQIVPGEQPGDSDLLINWTQARMFRFDVSADDSGSAATGKYQGGATLSVDNPFGWQDLFYLTLNSHLYGQAQQGEHGTKGWAAHYSVPVGYWLMALQANEFRYHQTVAGATQNYTYSGTSFNSEFKIGRLIYRDGVRKTTVTLGAYQRRSRNFIEDTEVEVQRRRMGGFSLNLTHKEFIGDATLDGALAYKKGTGAFGSIPAPEEAYGEGVARPQLITADLNLGWPIGQHLQYQAVWRAQWNRTPLIPQDRFAIGGRYTVRGFDGETTLSAERGWLVRNDLSWSVGGAQQIYVALDVAQVAGPSASRLLGKRLAGAALGWRGQFKSLQYDLFAGAPIRKPDGFRTAAVAHGFNLNYKF